MALGACVVSTRPIGPSQGGGGSRILPRSRSVRSPGFSESFRVCPRRDSREPDPGAGPHCAPRPLGAAPSSEPLLPRVVRVRRASRAPPPGGMLSPARGHACRTCARGRHRPRRTMKRYTRRIFAAFCLVRRAWPSLPNLRQRRASAASRRSVACCRNSAETLPNFWLHFPISEGGTQRARFVARFIGFCQTPPTSGALVPARTGPARSRDGVPPLFDGWRPLCSAIASIR